MILQGTQYDDLSTGRRRDISHFNRSGGLPSTIEGVMLPAFHDSQATYIPE